MKFLHTSDIHIGAKFEFLGDNAKTHREQVKKTFSKTVDLAIEKKVQLFLVAGDLFDSTNPAPDNIEFVKNEFKRLVSEGIEVCIIPGNHDYTLCDENDIGGEFQDLKGVYLFTDTEGSKLTFDDFKVLVYAKANNSNKSSESPMISAEEGHEEFFKIVMAHGGVVGQARNPEWPISPKEIEKSNADYVALGDWHSFRKESTGDVEAYYPGSPEVLNISQTGSGNVILGEFKDKKLDIQPVRVSEYSAESVEVEIGEIESIGDLDKRIKEHAKENIALTVTLTGLNKNKINFNVDDLEERLGENFWRLYIIDKTKLPLDGFNEKEYPPVLASGQFVKLMKGKIEEAETEEDRKLYEEALQFGLAAFKDQNII